MYSSLQRCLYGKTLEECHSQINLWLLFRGARKGTVLNLQCATFLLNEINQYLNWNELQKISETVRLKFPVKVISLIGESNVMLLYWYCDVWYALTDLLLCPQAGNPEDVPPVIATPHHYLLNIYRNQLYFVAVVTTEGLYSVHRKLKLTHWNEEIKYS